MDEGEGGLDGTVGSGDGRQVNDENSGGGGGGGTFYMFANEGALPPFAKYPLPLSARLRLNHFNYLINFYLTKISFSTYIHFQLFASLLIKVESVVSSNLSFAIFYTKLKFLSSFNQM